MEHVKFEFDFNIIYTITYFFRFLALINILKRVCMNSNVCVYMSDICIYVWICYIYAICYIYTIYVCICSDIPQQTHNFIVPFTFWQPFSMSTVWQLSTTIPFLITFAFPWAFAIRTRMVGSSLTTSQLTIRPLSFDLPLASKFCNRFFSSILF